MSLIADALKRAQEQRQAGQGEDKARRMLRGSGPLRVESRDGPRLTKPVALAGAAVVVGAIALASAIVLTPTPSPPDAVAAGGAERGPSVERGPGVASAGGDGPGGEGGVAARGGLVASADATGVEGEWRDRGRADGDASTPGRATAPGGDRVSDAAAGVERSPTADAGPAPGSGVRSSESASDGTRGDPDMGSTFRITVRGGDRDRTAEQYYGSALGAQRAGDLEQSASLYRAALELRPGDAELWNNLGAVYRRLGMSTEALAAFRSAVEVSPSYAPAWSNLGLALNSVGREAEAVEAFREALRHDPGNVGAKVNLANSYQGLGMPGEARSLLQEVLRDDPTLPEAHYGLARVLEEEGALEEAARHYRLFLELGRGRFPGLETRVADHVARLPGGGS